MIGLELMLSIKGMNKSDLAKELGISKQAINFWVNKKSLIPRKHYGKLNEIFPEIPDIFFNKELTVEDKTYITLILLENESKDNNIINEILKDTINKIRTNISL